MALITVTKRNDLLERLKMKTIMVKTELEELRKINQAIGLLQRQLGDFDVERILLQNSRIIFCTLSFAGQQRMEGLRMTTLIIDEAAQATEAETVIPFSLEPMKCLLVGDANQLPAMVKSNDVARENHFDWSMMHRPQNEAKYPHKLLNIQYRMDPQIRAWPSRRFYRNALEEAFEIGLRPGLQLPRQLAPYTFLDVKSEEVISYSSRRNERESALVVQCVRYLVNRHVCETNEIGIMTFYSGQVDQINQDLRNERMMGLEAQTVDGFQGEEKDIIIISFVLSNQQKTVGFLNDFRRLNVALTRAKRVLIMIGDSSTLIHDEVLASMLKHVVQHHNLHESSVVALEVFQSKQLFSAALPLKTLSPNCRFPLVT